MYLASAIEKRFKSHLRFLCENLERGRHKKKKEPEDTLNGTVNCLETAVLFTDERFFLWTMWSISKLDVTARSKS